VRGKAVAGGLFSLLVTLGVLVSLLLPTLATAKPSPTPFSLEPGSFKVVPSTLAAGAHPDLTVSFGFSRDEADKKPFNDVRNVAVDLPPGFAGSPAAIPTCTIAQLHVSRFGQECPLASQIGTVSIEFVVSNDSLGTFTLPLFNMESGGSGTPAVLGFRHIIYSQLVPITLRPGDSGLSVGLPEIPLAAEPSRISLTIWGVPASSAHDPQRGRECTPVGLVSGEVECNGGDNPAGVPERPFLDNPTRCGPAIAKFAANSWEEPATWSTAEAEAGPIVGCESVPFSPSVEIKTTSAAAESPTGLDLDLTVPQDREGAASIASASLSSVLVALPEGLSINPARSPAVCSREEFERETAVPPPRGGCPAASVLGTAEVETPLLDEAAVGSIYMAKPYDNPFGSRFGLYLVVRAAASGVVVRLAGQLLSDPDTGRLRLGFEEIPQLPLSRLAVHLPQGDESLLVTPPVCGRYGVETALTPSSDPFAPRREIDQIEFGTGPGGTPCPTGMQLRPRLTVRAQKPLAGAFSPLHVRLRRADGEAQIARLSLRLPAGLAASLAAVVPCPDAALAAAAGKTGAEEQVNPSCPPASAVGRTVVDIGVGDRLARVGGSLYLAGRYRGAPLSLAAVVPATLGPFDLGTVVVREAVRVDRRTGEVVVGSPRSDRLPRVVGGVSLRLRELNAYLDRPRFLRTPTSCAPLLARGTAIGTAGLGNGPEVSSSLSAPFRVKSCDELRFAPGIRLRLAGGVHRNGHPALRIAVSGRRGESGLADGAIRLPHTQLIDLSHVRGVCTPQRLRERSCPPDSAYGYARAVTPLVSEPLRGPVYLRSTKGGLPVLVAALRNRRLAVDVVARLEATPGALRLAPEGVPDLPISRLLLSMKGGRAGLLVNSVDLCTSPSRAVVRLHSHSGEQVDRRPRLLAACHSRER